MFALLGWLVAINGMATLASHEEADNHSFLLGLSVPSAFLFGFLGFYKLRIAHEVDSMAPLLDGFYLQRPQPAGALPLLPLDHPLRAS